MLLDNNFTRVIIWQKKGKEWVPMGGMKLISNAINGIAEQAIFRWEGMNFENFDGGSKNFPDGGGWVSPLDKGHDGVRTKKNFQAWVNEKPSLTGFMG